MGICDTALAWFKNYLSGRSQKVNIGDELSDPLDINISVMQGSILGPILFLCDINDGAAWLSMVRHGSDGAAWLHGAAWLRWCGVASWCGVAQMVRRGFMVRRGSDGAAWL